MLIDLICKSTFLEKEYVTGLIDRANSCYFRFSIPKKDGGFRIIHRPTNELKTIQRIVHDKIILSLPVHFACMAYRQGSNIRKHALVHKNKNFVLRIDLKRFFSSINSKDVCNFAEKAVKETFGDWSEVDTQYFSKLVCYKGSLVMGAVTSPSLTNALCFDLDSKLHEVALENSIIYTRYSDDLYFSTNTAGVLRSFEKKVNTIIESLECPSSLQINTKKTYHSSRKRKIVVTGLVLTNDGHVSLGRRKKREIRSSIFNWFKLSDDEKKYLSGYISYISSIEPEFINSLCQKYGSEIIKSVITYNSNKL